MDIQSISFSTWCRNHEDTHSAKWCRELYPWEVFAKASYSDNRIGADQPIFFGGTEYVVRVMKRWTGDNGRSNFLLHLTTSFQSRRSSWENRHWDDTFQLVAAPDGYFITLFTKRKDPSEQLLADFMNERFGKVGLVRSKPLSALLFRSLISYAAEEAFGPLARFASFPMLNVVDNAANDNKHGVVLPTEFAPFLSMGRELWVGYSFTEEKAHRFALYNAPQCARLIVVYCLPTFTQHQRCKYQKADIVSLPELLQMVSPEIRHRYMPQARFLMNHLAYNETTMPSASAEDLKRRLLASGSERLPVFTSILREAKVGLGLCVDTVGDCAYFFACANLINAALNEKLGTYQGSQQLRKEVYSFKSVVGKIIEHLTGARIPGVSCYFGADGVAYVDILGVQFSFHAIPRTRRIADYISSGQNIPQPWSGIRLQPIAPLVLEWATALVRENSKAWSGT